MSSTSRQTARAPSLPSGPREELAAGLRLAYPRISPKFLYDSLGCKLFEAICELPEYYPTRTEATILREHGPAIARACDTGATMIDLGAGNCAKAAALFPNLQPRHYVAVDIAGEFVHDAVERLRQRFPAIGMQAIGLDFSTEFDLPGSVAEDRRLFFYPGSSIGNFSLDEANAFLSRLRKHCGDDGGLLIGIDLIKDTATLNAAYNDALGVTAAFNLNILNNANAIAGTNFDVRDWRHNAFFNPVQGRVEMHLEAKSSVTVRWPGGERYFVKTQTIHTENSYKYTLDGATALLGRGGWQVTNAWTDPDARFAVIHARPADRVPEDAS
jgi:dimethylhistidine N-methyltransferase